MSNVIDQVRDDEVLDLLTTLVRIPSLNPPGDVRAAADMVQSVLEGAGIECTRFQVKDGAPNVIARLPGKRPGRTLLYNGHVDVVPPGENWTVDPFGAEFLDGKVYGRGTSDMKGGVVSMMAAMLALKRSGAEFAGEVILTAVADEETGSPNGTIPLMSSGEISADFAVVSEPSSLRIDLGNRGLVWLEVTVNGRASHAGRPHLGVNAIHHAATLIDAITGMEFGVRNDLFDVPVPSISVTTIQGGNKVNIIPERCTFGIDRRMIAGEDSAQAIGQIERVIASLAKPGIAIETKVQKIWEPCLISADEPIVAALTDVTADVTGVRPGVGAKAGSTDASFLINQAKIPTAIFGPGNPGLAHVADEYVELSQVVKAAKIFAALPLRLLS